MTVVNKLVARISIDWSLDDTTFCEKIKKFILTYKIHNWYSKFNGSHGNYATLYFTSQTLVNISSASGAGASARGLFGTCRDQLESEKSNCESQTFHNFRQSALIQDCLASCKFLHEHSIKNKYVIICISTYLCIFHIVT